MSIPGISLEGQVALVTGARRGIGEACALVMAEAGADVAVCDWVVETGELAEVAEKIKKLGRHSISVKADAKNSSDVESMVQKVVDEFGTIDILINNAGVGGGNRSPEPGDFDSEAVKARMAERMSRMQTDAVITGFDEEYWDKTLENNMKSCLLCSKAAAKIMVERKKGNIINITSVQAFARGISALSAYSVSKRGIVMLTEGLASDLGRHNIRVNAIAPGGIDTEMMRYVTAFPERVKALTDRMPLTGNSLIPPSACAHAALFLVSDLAAYITGQIITVDGGLMINPFRQ